jgi:hypothetical protein
LTTTFAELDSKRPAPTAAAKRRRLFWMQQLRRWHWISSALCLIGLVAFASTGVTLNHATQIEAKPKVVSVKAQLPVSLLARLAAAPQSGKGPLPADLRGWIDRDLSVEVGGRPAEWSADEAYISLPRPGGDAWLSIDRQSGAVEYEKTTRGVVALLNDLHKGRNAGPVWGWFLDLFAGACLVFSLTGLFLLHLHAHARLATWPLVGAGLAIPLLLALMFLHL